MSALVGFVLTAPLSFALGWFTRGFTDRHLKGFIMKAKTKAYVDRILDWLADSRKLTVLVIVTAVAVLASLAYTFASKQASDQRAEQRVDDVIICVQRYIIVLSKANIPRTAASVAASDARHDWDMGHSDAAPNLTKEQLKLRYDELYRKYEKVRAGNPLPEFSRAFCEEATR